MAHRRDSFSTATSLSGADELMITSQIFDPRARLRSFEIVAQLAQRAAA